MPSPLQDLELIRQVMADSQRVVRDDGKHFLAWGICLMAGLVATQVVLVVGAHGFLLLVWGVSLGAGWAYSLWQGGRDRVRARVRTLSARLLASIWVGRGLTMTLLAALGLMKTLVPAESLSGLFALLIGGGFYMSACLIEKWLRLAALGWWVGGCALLIVPTMYSPLIFAGLVLVFQIVPAVVLGQRARQVQSG